MIYSGIDLELIQLLYIFGYSIEKLICFCNVICVYWVCRFVDGEFVMLKCLGSEYEVWEVIVSLKYEYEIGRNLLVVIVICMYVLEYYCNLLVVVLEDFGGDLLLNLMVIYLFELVELFFIGVQLVQGLGEIYVVNIIYKDINFFNVVYNFDIGVLKIIDFGILSFFIWE